MLRTQNNGVTDEMAKSLGTAALRSCTQFFSEFRYPSNHLWLNVIKQGSPATILTRRHSAYASSRPDLDGEQNTRVLTQRGLRPWFYAAAQKGQTQKLRTFIAQLQNKIKAQHTNKSLIVTEFELGYCFNNI